jgi:hypothetical protein
MSEEPGSDPIGDLQRWLMRAGARSVTREVTDRVKSTIGGAGKAGKNADVWDTATTEGPTDEPPECQWCPICRAARRARDGSAPSAGLSGQFAGAADALAGLTRDAFSLFEAAMRTPPPRPAGSSAPAGSAPAGSTATTGTPAPSTPAPSTPAPSSPAASDKPNTPDEPDTQTWVSSDDGTVVGPGVGWPTVVHPKHEHDEAAHESGDRQERGEPGDRGPDGGTDQQVEGTAE